MAKGLRLRRSEVSVSLHLGPLRLAWWHIFGRALVMWHSEPDEPDAPMEGPYLMVCWGRH